MTSTDDTVPAPRNARKPPAGRAGTRSTDERPMTWRYAGDQLKRWREAAGVSRQRLADSAGYGYDSIKGMERGVRKPQLHVLRLADELCGAQGKLAAAEEFLRPDPFPSYSHDYMAAEGEAVAISSYQSEFIPGQLQTEETIRALFSAYCPPLDDETVEERTKARLERQHLLNRQTTAFSFVIAENALRDGVTSSEAHARQLRHLVAVTEARNVSLQVLRAGNGPHPGRRGPFVLLETPDHRYLAYEEGQTTGVLYDDPSRVSMLHQRHEMILRQALAPGESAEFILKVAEEL